MQDKTIELMSPETKDWFARAVVGMILADGRIDKAEIEYLNNLIGFLNDNQLIRRISTLLKNNEMPTLEPLEIVTNEALEIVKHLTVMAVVDEELANREVHYLKYVTDQLGLPAEIPDRFLSLAKEKLRRAKYTARLTTKEFSEQVRCFDLTGDCCMFYSFHAIKSKTPVTLQLYKEAHSNHQASLFQLVTAETSWSRPVQSKYGNFVVSVTFDKPINENQGLELIRCVHLKDENP
jgi:uncharacterized tellurite resistance protein B-like protein